MLSKRALTFLLSLQILLVSIVQPVYAIPVPKSAQVAIDFGRTKSISASEHIVSTMANVRLKLKNDPQWKKKATKKVVDGAKLVTIKPTVTSLKTVGHSGQTMLVLAMLSMLEVASKKSHQKKILGQELSLNELLDIAYESFMTIINSGEIYFAMAGATTVSSGVAVGTAAKTLFNNSLGITREAISKSSVFLKFLKSFFVFGLGSLITFLGWEAGVQLWQEAIYMLESPEEINAAEALMSSGEFAHWLSGQEATTKNQILFSKIMTNAYIILFDNEELRAAWLYNAWRKRIANGDFVVLLTSVIVSGFLGMKFGGLAGGAVGGVPGAVITGFFGFIGGVGGAYLGIIAPAWMKEPITKMIVNLRRGMGRSRLHVNEQEIRGLFRRYYIPYGTPDEVVEMLRQNDTGEEYRIKRLQHELDRRSGFRNDVLTAYFETYYRAQEKILTITRDIALANVILKLDLDDVDFSQVEMNVATSETTENPSQEQIVMAQEVIDDGLIRIEKLQSEIDNVELSLLKFYDTEARTLSKFLEMKDHSPTETAVSLILTELLFMKMFNAQIISTVVGMEPGRIHDVEVAFIENTLGYYIDDYPVMTREDYDFGNLNALQECELNMSAKVNLNAFYDHAFNEKKLLKLMIDMESKERPAQRVEVSKKQQQTFLKQCVSWQEFRQASQ